MPKTSSPTEKPCTSAATASTTPDTSDPGMTGKGTGGLPLRRKHRIPVAQVPVGGIDAHRVNANKHLTRLQLGHWRIFIAQHLRTTEFVQPNRLHRVSRHCFILITADWVILEWRARVRFEMHAVQELARKRETLVGRQNKCVLSDGIKCSRHGRTVNRVFNAVEFRENARSGLTSPVTCRRPTASFGFSQNRKRAVVRWNGLVRRRCSD